MSTGRRGGRSRPAPSGLASNTSRPSRDQKQPNIRATNAFGRGSFRGSSTTEQLSSRAPNSNIQTTRGGGRGTGGRVINSNGISRAGSVLKNHGRNTVQNIQRRDDNTSDNYGNAQNHEEHYPQNREAPADQRLQQLKKRRAAERAKAIKDGLMADPDVPRSLSEAITLVGTCQDMCPEYERVTRIVQNDVWDAECDPSTVGSYSNRKPDEERMVKKFRRPAAGIEEQIPSDLRPPVVLERTLDYLVDEIIGKAESLKPVYNFIWDRTRGIRNDFSVQQLRDTPQLRVAINCFERIVRFHLLTRHQIGGQTQEQGAAYNHQQDLEQCIKTLVSLMAYYDAVRDRYRPPNEAEFRAYWIITRIPEKSESDVEFKIQSWPKDILQHPRVKLARQIYTAACNAQNARTYTQAVAQQHFMHFWSLIDSPETSYMTACAAEIFFDLIRKPALYMIEQAYYRGGGRQVDEWTLDQLIEPLGLENEEEVQEYVEAHGFTVQQNDTGDLYLDISNAQARTYAEIAAIRPPRVQFFSETLVESKRFARTFPALINGLSSAQARELGQVDESLFIPEDEEEEVEDEQEVEEAEEEQVEDDEEEDEPKSASATKFNPAASEFKFPTFGTPTAPTNLGTSLFDRIKKPPTSDAQPPETVASPATTSPFSFFTSKPAVSAPTVASPFAQDQTSTAPSLFSSISKPEENSTTTFETQPFVYPPVTAASLAAAPGFPPVSKVETAPPKVSAPTVPQLPLLSSPFSFFESNTAESARPAPNTTNQSNTQTPAFSWGAPKGVSSSNVPSTAAGIKPTPFAFPKTADTAAMSAKTDSKIQAMPLPSTTSPFIPSNTGLASFDFGGSSANQQGSSPSFSPTGNYTVSTLVTQKSARAERRELALAYLTDEVLLNPVMGLLKMYIEHHARPIYDTAVVQHERKTAKLKADQFRNQILARRYFGIWKAVASLRKRKRQGRERRARLAAEKAARAKAKASLARKNPSFDYAAEMTRFEEVTEAAERALRSSGGSSAAVEVEPVPVKAVDKGKMPIRNGEITPPKRPAFRHRVEAHRSSPDVRNDGLNGASRRPTGKEAADSLLRKSFLTGEPLRDGHATGRISTVKSNYFKLKAMGLEYLTESYKKREKRKREELSAINSASASLSPTNSAFEFDEDLPAASKRRSLADISKLTYRSPDISSENKRKTRNDALAEDEALFARARAVMKALDEGSAFYREETRKMEEDELRRSGTSSGGSTPFGNSGNSRSVPSVPQESSFKVATAQHVSPTSSHQDHLLESARNKLPKFWFRDSKFLPRSEYGLGPRSKRAKTDQKPSPNSPAVKSKPQAAAETHALNSSFASSNGYVTAPFNGYSEAQPREDFEAPQQVSSLVDDDDEDSEGQSDLFAFEDKEAKIEDIDEAEGDSVETDGVSEELGEEEDDEINGEDWDEEGQEEYDSYDESEDDERGGYVPPSHLQGGNSADDAIEL